MRSIHRPEVQLVCPYSLHSLLFLNHTSHCSPTRQVSLREDWWKGWKDPQAIVVVETISQKSINPAHQVSIHDAWWE